MLKKVLRQYLAASLIFFGTIVWSLTMIRSGLLFPYGYGFWGANGHDGIWHLALSKSLAKGSVKIPVFSGELLKNYHLGFDLLLAVLYRLTHIQINILYFQILPIIFSLLIGFLTSKFVYLWRKSKDEAFWATFFVYFGSSFGFLITFIRDGIFTGESMFWSQQSASTLVNPPFALSLIFILLGLIALQKKNIFLSILFFGLLIQIKAYAAILVLGGLFVAGLFELFSVHRSLFTKVFFGSLLFNLTFFYLVKNDGLSTFILQPFWFLETLMSYSDRLGWQKYYSAMTTYKMGKIWFKEIIAYSGAFVIFLMGNMGARIIGFYYYLILLKKKFKVDGLLVLISSIMIMAVVIPMFFVQKGTPWNTIQFFYYYLFFLSIFAGISTSIIIKKLKPLSKKIFLIILFIFTVFGIWATLQHYLPKMPQAIISTKEIEALNFLAGQENGVVLVYPFDKYKAKEAEKFPPRPLYFYESTAYVSAFTNKPVFLEDEVNLNIMGYGWKNRREEILWFVSNLDKNKGKEFLLKNNIKYLYLVKKTSPLFGEVLKLGEDDLALTKIFENDIVNIFQVD